MIKSRPIIALALTLFTVLPSLTCAPAIMAAAGEKTFRAQASTTSENGIDDLFPADTYAFYGELRLAGYQQNFFTLLEIVTPVLPLLSKEDNQSDNLLPFLTTYAPVLEKSHISFGAFPVKTSFPTALALLELPTAEQATAFEADFKKLIIDSNKKSGTTGAGKDLGKTAIFTRNGRFIAISDRTVTLDNLKTAAKSTLAGDTTFRAVRDHFPTEPLFFYSDMNLLKTGIKQLIETSFPSTPKSSAALVGKDSGLKNVAYRQSVDSGADYMQLIKQALDSLATTWPRAIGGAVAFDNGDLVSRALFVNGPKTVPSLLEILPVPVLGPAVAPKAARLMPADTGLYFMSSLDLPRTYDQVYGLAAAILGSVTEPGKESGNPADSVVKDIETKYGFKIRDQLLKSLGSEFAVGAKWSGDPLNPMSSTKGGADPVYVILAVNDRETLTQALPGFLEAAGLRQKDEQPTTEKVGDYAILHYPKVSLAFVDGYLVCGQTSDMIRQSLKAYTSKQSLAETQGFAGFTSRLPATSFSQFYMPGAFTEQALAEARKSADQASDAVRSFFKNYTLAGRSLSFAQVPDPLGMTQEFRVPNNLITLAFAGGLADSSIKEIGANETSAQTAVTAIGDAESDYRKKARSKTAFASMELLQTKGLLDKEVVAAASKEYRITVKASPSGYVVTATPLKYGQTARRSFYNDQKGTVRAGDHNGQPATASDQPVAGAASKEI